MAKKIIKIYWDRYLDTHKNYPNIPHVLDVTYILYETSSIFGKRRIYDCFLSGVDYILKNYEKTDTYLRVINPWLHGANLQLLEEELINFRNNIDPNNTFRYKEYKNETS